VTDVLPDVLAPDLRLVVCGSAAGAKSAAVGAYYAGPGNRFWPTLYRTGLTPALLQPAEFRSALLHGIGLTDIAKKVSGADSELRAGDFDRDGLRARIETFQPRVLAFNGKNAGARFFNAPVDYGWQANRSIGSTRIYVTPSTSAAARAFWDEEPWRELAGAVRSL
jgi:TDG/mug DNA glycosylase family protein